MRRLFFCGLAFVVAIISCGKDITGPVGASARYIRGLSWNAVFPPAFQVAGGSDVVQFTKVHVVLHHDDGTVALDTTINFPAGVDSVPLNLTVKLLDNAPTSGEPMTLDLGYLNAAGDVVFSGGPIDITAAPPPAGGGSNPPVQVPVKYVGTGASATAVVISPRTVSAVSGSPFSFSAVAKDVNGNTIAGTPILWNSLDPTIATITSAAAGAGITQNQRGTARIVAQLLTGPTDTVQVIVSLPASQIIAQSGNAQTGVAGAALALPLVVKVAASDGVGVAGTTVNFAVATGGGSVANASVVSDANGLAQTTWKLGTGTGAQSVTATAGSLTNSPLTFSAGAQAATASKLVVTTGPVNGVAGTPLTAVVISAEDNNGNVASTFTGPVTVAFGTNTPGATLSGTTTVNAVAGVATFSTLTVNKNGTAYTLVASSTGLTSVTTSAFDIAVGAPSKLIFSAQPTGGIANVALPAIVVNAQDSQGNPTPAFTGTVTLSLGTNPANAALGGTLTAAAVAGVATFSSISISTAGTGYILAASATGLTAAVGTAFNIGGGVATTLSLSSGGGQTGAPSSPLASPIVVRVADGGGNGIAGKTVTFAILTGGGALSGGSTMSDASGFVSANWTLGSALGLQTISATSAGLSGSPLTISATAAFTSASKVWTGATDIQWSTATNWSPAGVPAAIDSVLVPNTANHPTVSTNAAVASVTLAAGAPLTVASGQVLTITGALDATGGILGSGTVALGGGVPRTLKGSITASAITIGGSYSLNGAFTTIGNLTITSGSLTLNGQSAVINGIFCTSGTGTLTMTNAADALSVTGDVRFGGGATTGLITNGMIGVGGNFMQAGTSNAFDASGANQVVFTGVSSSVTMANPTTSRFGNFIVPAASTDGVYLQSNIVVLGAVTVDPASSGINGSSYDITLSGALSDPSVLIYVCSITFAGTGAQTIPALSFNEMVIVKGTPTLASGGFSTAGNLIVNGGTLTMGGQGVVANGNFATVNGGMLVMTNAADSLFVIGNATFAGAAEAGHLTNGVLVLFEGIQVSAAGQFNATGSHLTYMVGPAGGDCECDPLRVASGNHLLKGLTLAARHARNAANAKSIRALAAQRIAIRKALFAKSPSRMIASRTAAAAGNVQLAQMATLARAAQQSSQPGQRGLAAQRSAAMALRPLSRMLRGAVPAGGARMAGGQISASVVTPIGATSSDPICVAFSDTTGNQFANVRMVGQVSWQTYARATGNVQVDTTGDVEGNGRLVVGGTLYAAGNSTVEPEAVELFGVLADTGFFSPDTTVFSGASQTIPYSVGGGELQYYNIIVNSPALARTTDDNDLEIGGSLFIMNSGRLQLGVVDPTCPTCESGFEVDGALETHNSGTIAMTLPTNPYLVVYDSAWFAGGSTAGLLIQGEIDFYGNFRQSGGATTAYVADSPNESYFGNSTQTVTFANPGYALSHFGDVYFGNTDIEMASSMFADGELETGHTAAHTIHALTQGDSITTRGADVRDLLFNGARWVLLDGDSVTDMDEVEFSNQLATSVQFEVQRTGAGPFASMTNWIFDTSPTGPGLYIKATDTDGASSNGPLTLTLSGTSPGTNGGFTSAVNGAIINGWSSVVANWLGVNSTWTNTANWSTGLVPDGTTDVAITCDCSAPQLNAAAAVHNLSISNGNQLTLGVSAPLTVNGNLTVASNSDINVGSASVTLLGNVTMDPTASPAGVFCGSGATGAILAGSGTQNVTGKFCRLIVNSNVVAAGAIVVKNNTPSDGGLLIQSGGNINFNSQRVETDSMSTTGTGTFTMTHPLDSLIIHGANGNFAVNFIGGSETGLITNGTIVMRSPNFHATGTSFDATFNNVVVADTTGGQTFRWTGATVGHGFNNLILKNSNFDNFGTTDLVVQGTLTLDASMGTSGQFAATGASLYAGSLVDNTGNATGGFAGAYWIHLTQSGAAPAKLPVDSLFFEFGGTMQLANNVTTSAVVVVRPDVLTSSNTGLYLNGHTLKTTNRDFITTGTAFLDMQTAGDSLDVGTANVFFNGGGATGALTTGGIAAGGFYQGYTNTTTLASGTAANSYSPSGTHRIWLTGNAKVIFANPGTGVGASHFNSLHQPAGFTTKLYSDVFIDDSLYLNVTGTAFTSDQPAVLGKTRLITTKGLSDNTLSNNASFTNVSLKFVDGQPSPSNWSGISWTAFPTGFTGNVFEIARTTGSSASVLDSHIFSTISFGAGGEYINNTGTLTWGFTNTTCTAAANFTLTAGQKTP